MQALTPQADLSHALTQAFEQQRRALYAQALAILAEPAAAEDAVQEAFVRVWRRRERLDDPGRLAGYLATAVRHLALPNRIAEPATPDWWSRMSHRGVWPL